VSCQQTLLSGVREAATTSCLEESYGLAEGLARRSVVSLPALSVMLKQGGQDSRSDRPSGGLVLTELRAWQAQQASGTDRPTHTEIHRPGF